MLHEDRLRAASFGEDARRYDRARPSYPEAMVRDLLVDEPHAVLDVGCGTGIASHLFTRRGCHVLGVEPDERMAAFARHSGLEVKTSAFEDWKARGRSFDLLICGQAWHWVDPVVGAAKAATVVRPGGRLGLFWNCGFHEPELKAAFDDVYRRFAPGLDTYSILLGFSGHDRFEIATAGLERGHCFEPVQQRTYRWQKCYSRDEWLDQLPTHSDHRMLPPAQRDRLLAALGEEIDQRGGSLTMYYDTVLLMTLRLPIP